MSAPTPTGVFVWNVYLTPWPSGRVLPGPGSGVANVNLRNDRKELIPLLEVEVALFSEEYRRESFAGESRRMPLQVLTQQVRDLQPGEDRRVTIRHQDSRAALCELLEVREL